MKKEVKRLYRSRKDKIIGGVCGGMGEFFHVDPVWIRLIIILLALVEGSGFIIYVIAWIIIPKNPYQKEIKKTIVEKTITNAKKSIRKSNKHERKVLFGMILVFLGALLLTQNFYKIFDANKVIAAIIIIAGTYLVLKKE